MNVRVLTLILGASILVAAASTSYAASNNLCVALRFDDGPDVDLTPKLVKILTDAQVPATFFEVGQRVATWPQVTEMVYNAGFEIANHSWDHPDLTKLSSDAVASEISRADVAIRNATGGFTPTLFGAPYGAHSARIDSLTGGRPDVMWDIDTLDWEYTNNSARVENVASTSGSGIILMHDIHAWTVAAVPGLIAQLKAEGATFVTVSQYLAGACSNKGPAPIVAQTAPPAPPAVAKPAAAAKVAVVAAKPAPKPAAKPAPVIAVVSPPPAVERQTYQLFDNE